MGIFSRMTDIVNSNIVNMLDKAENPDKMVRLMIQEMEDTLVEVKSQAARIIADKKTIERQISFLRKEEAGWAAKAELAISKERDDLARAALEEKSKKTDTAMVMENDLIQMDDSLEKYREDIAVLDGKLQEAKKRQKQIILRKQTATSRLHVRNKIKRADSNKAMNKFEQFERRIDHLEGEVEAFDIGRESNLDDEFKKLENESKIEEELKALKDKMNKNN